MKIKELREKKLPELEKTLLEFKKELFNLRFQKSSGQLEKTSEIKKTRKKIARLKTEINKFTGVANA